MVMHSFHPIAVATLLSLLLAVTAAAGDTDHCQTWQPAKCLACEPGYQATDDGCVPKDQPACAVENCDGGCVVGTTDECIRCKEGYFFLGNKCHVSTHPCSPSAYMCDDCYASRDGCAICRPGYYVSATTNQCQRVCLSYCAECHEGTSTKCKKCDAGFELNDDYKCRRINAVNAS